MLITTDCYGIGYENVDVIHLDEETVEWLAVLGTVMNIQLP
jgi:hypothetical protein